MNPFILLELPVSFDIDLSNLESNYFRLQRLYHPDRLIGKSEAEKMQAQSYSSVLNQAYEQLKDPLGRAQALLEIHSISLEANLQSVELLMEVMEWREELESATTLESLQRLLATLGNLKDQLLSTLTNDFKNYRWKAAADLTLKLQYLEKVMFEVKQHFLDHYSSYN